MDATDHLSFADAEPQDPRVLVRRALAGDKECAEALVRRLMPVIRARVRKSLRQRGQRLGPNEGDDLLQEIWLRMIEGGAHRLLAYEPSRGPSFEAYAGMIAERELAKLGQKAHAKKRSGALVATGAEHDEVISDRPSPESEVTGRQLASRLGDHLDRLLPPRGQLVLRYTFIDELPADRVAELLRVSVQVVYNWQHKIRSEARAFLKRNE